MAHHGGLENQSQPDDFLVEEYKGLMELDKARNERFDRLVTMFLSLAGAPWVLYALVIKEKGSFTVGDMPWLIAVVFLIVGLLGFLVVIMCVQTKFNITMYMRAVNTIRGYFVGKVPVPADGFRLPTQGDRPPYKERGSYNFYAALGMALVNGSYVSLAFYRLFNYWLVWKWRAVLIGISSGSIWVVVHYWYYYHQAQKRETGKRELKFHNLPAETKSAAPIE